ncbi:hypothetical protein [Glacieibacterium frigidum]|uniref:Uncharacterized protein n=1 Tax=Glacieibacterium frigidum TaxID=2593303 RepID=A0A552U999_9SPHN|nr:hypothetical protein [Glacieibacterium frigidum]TRW14793.1 hypothetical protein FMM06_14020 [Glacieibacterium frigidum]
MNTEAQRAHSAQALIAEIDETKTTPFVGLPEEDLQAAESEVMAQVAVFAERNRHLRKQRASRRHGASEDARRRLQSPKMDTNYPQDIARALILKRSQLRQEVAEDKLKLYVSSVKLEVVNAELEPTREMLVGLEKDRDFFKSTGLYERSGAFIARLFKECGKGWMDLDLLTGDQHNRIVAIICEP